jgi:hypothetical protein
VALFLAITGKHKFPYHRKIRFVQQIGFIGTINPFIPKIRCTISLNWSQLSGTFFHPIDVHKNNFKKANSE